MDVVHPRCAGLDIHKKTVAACVLVGPPGGPVERTVKTFGTMTEDLLALSDWLQAHGVTHVAMESTGVYWKPVYNLLEGSFKLLLVNAQHVKAVPGRKTDVRDSEWLADLLRHGLLRASFVPDRPQRELRELTRYRTSLVRERAAEVNRLQATLEGANLKLASVATDVLGKSGREILAALIGGETEAEVLADRAKGRLRAKLPELERALVGRFAAHQRFLLARQLAHIEYLEGAIEDVATEITARLRPFDTAIERLDTIPGIGRVIAEALVAEIGTDMGQFPSAGHLASWAGLCPGNDESAGKRRSGRTRKGNKVLRALLVEAAHATGRAKNTYLSTKYHRLSARLGRNKAAIAVAHTILRIVYHLLSDPEAVYQDLGPHYFDQRRRASLERNLVRRLERLGFTVSLEARAA